MPSAFAWFADVGPSTVAPLALLGIDVEDLVEEVLRGLVDLVVPDVASQWAIELVAWLVAVPELDPAASGLLADLRTQLVGVGFGLLGVSFVAAALQLGLGAPSTFRSGQVLGRGAIAVGVLAAYPDVLPMLLRGTNLLTQALTHSAPVTQGLDSALGGALVIGAAATGVSVGLAVAAVLACAYFVAALIVFKVGLSAALAVLALAGGLMWGLYPLLPWLGRAWLSGVATVCLVTVTWSLVFAAAAVLAGDALPGTVGPDASTPAWLQQLMRPLTAAACFWLAYRTPGFLLASIRVAGITPAGFIGGPLGGAPAGSAAKRASRASKSGGSERASTVRRNRDRFSLITSRSGASAVAMPRRPQGRPATGARGAARATPQTGSNATGRVRSTALRSGSTATGAPRVGDHQRPPSVTGPAGSQRAASAQQPEKADAGRVPAAQRLTPAPVPSARPTAGPDRAASRPGDATTKHAMGNRGASRKPPATTRSTAGRSASEQAPSARTETPGRSSAPSPTRKPAALPARPEVRSTPGASPPAPRVTRPATGSTRKPRPTTSRASDAPASASPPRARRTP